MWWLPSGCSSTSSWLMVHLSAIKHVGSFVVSLNTPCLVTINLTSYSMWMTSCRLSFIASSELFNVWYEGFGQPSLFLGMHVQHTASSVRLLSQRQYMLDILDRARMVDCKPCSTHVDHYPMLYADGAPIFGPTIFSILAGALQYLTFTRPNIS